MNTIKTIINYAIPPAIIFLIFLAWAMMAVRSCDAEYAQTSDYVEIMED